METLIGDIRSDGLDCSGIKEGMTVRNYKEMCSLLGDKVTSGNAKMQQLKKWSHFFDYEKTGHQFHITDVHDDVNIEREDHRGRFGKYIQYIKPILAGYMCGNLEGKRYISVTRKGLFYILGLVNCKYPDCEDIELSGILDNSEYRGKTLDLRGVHLEVDERQLLYFQTVVYQKLNSVVVSSLNSLSRNEIIRVSTEYVVRREDRSYFIADEKQESEICDMRGQILNSLNVPDIKSAMLEGKMNAFHSRFDKIAFEKHKWTKVFPRTVISLTADNKTVKRFYDVCGEHFNTNDLRHGLNKEIVRYFTDNIENKKQMRIKMVESGEKGKTYWRKKLYDQVIDADDFVPAQMSLVEYFIKL